jgi:hypothetical protein
MDPDHDFRERTHEESAKMLLASTLRSTFQSPGAASSVTNFDPSAALKNYMQDSDLFHPINVEYPGLEIVSAEPYIFTVKDFLSAAEAAALRAKLDRNGKRAFSSSEKLQKLGDRISRSVVPRNDEVAGVRSRIAHLCNLDLGQLQPLKITRYEDGGTFKRHTDCTVTLGGGLDGTHDPARFPNRFCTVLLYLSDNDSGGRTAWRWRDQEPLFYAKLRAQKRLPPWAQSLGTRLAGTLGSAAPTRRRDDLAIAPRAGMAVIHLPCSSPSAGLVPDLNAEHESEPVVGGEKYVCQQFCWSAVMADNEAVDERLRTKFAAFEAEQSEEPLTNDVL